MLIQIISFDLISNCIYLMHSVLTFISLVAVSVVQIHIGCPEELARQLQFLDVIVVPHPPRAGIPCERLLHVKAPERGHRTEVHDHQLSETELEEDTRALRVWGRVRAGVFEVFDEFVLKGR